MKEVETSGKPNPLLTSSWWDQLTFKYVEPLLKKSKDGQELQIEDIYSIPDNGKTKTITDQLEREWDREAEKHKTGKPASLTFALYRAHWHLIGFSMIFIFIENVARAAQPVFFKWLLESFDSANDESSLKSVCWCFGITATAWLEATFGPHTHTTLQQAYRRMNTSTRALVYRKLTRLSKSKVAEVTTGHIIELFNEAPLVRNFIWGIHALYLAPLKIAFALWFLYKSMGVAVFTGYLTVVILIPLQVLLGRLCIKWREKKSETQDKRVQLMSEIISGMRLIKMYCWEAPFGNLLRKLRETELAYGWRKCIYDSLLHEMYTVNVQMVGVVVVLASVAMGADLGPVQILPALSLMSMANRDLLKLVTWDLKDLMESRSAMRRVEKFLLLEETLTSNFQTPEDSDTAIVMKNVSAAWDKKSSALQELNVTIGKGDFVVIVGEVGSGKSSFLHLITGELCSSSGLITRDGSVVQITQVPFVFPGSVRDNILFGSDFDPVRYDEVINVTALREDLESFDLGDETLVGENGVTLSGGQKARLGLARAIYQKADTYLLDDPLSAVDTAVGNHIYQRCIKKFLKGKTRILVTHQLHFARGSDKIVIFEKGKILAQGTYQEIKDNDNDICKMLTEESTGKTLEKEAPAEKENLNAKAVESNGDIEDLKKSIDPWRTLKGYFGFNPDYKYIIIAVVLTVVRRSMTYVSDWLLVTGNKDELFSPWSYAVTVLLLTVVLFMIGFSLGLAFYRSSVDVKKNCHNQLYEAVVRAPISFFDTNSSGRIINRFSGDLGAMDNVITSLIFSFLQYGVVVLFNIFLVVYVNVWLVLPIGFLMLSVYRNQQLFTPARIDGLNLEMKVHSPILTHLKVTLEGLETVRSMGRVDFCIRVNESLLQRNDSVLFTNKLIWNWFFSQMRRTVSLFTACAVFSFLFISRYEDPTFSAMSLSYLMPMMEHLTQLAHESTYAVYLLNRVERILQYCDLKPEAALHVPSIEGDWPSAGHLSFQNVNYKYREDGDTTLTDINFNIKSGEKIGIVGRTGAGKSTLAEALFRMAEPEGDILIDGVKTSSLGLHHVRSNISIIPQNPVLFSGSVRQNLDPFEEYTDSRIWDVLTEVQMVGPIRRLPDGLASAVTERGANFSVGQRQLLCLARSVLKKNKILVMDEATASVDSVTDELIQKTIRKTFEDCTVLTVAHRLNTVMDCDRIMVLKAGRVVEFGSPHVLLSAGSGPLVDLVTETGGAQARRLSAIARRAHQSRQNNNNPESTTRHRS